LTQTPATQTRLPLQLLPQTPQFAESVSVSTHAPEQREKPALQVVVQVLAAHCELPLAMLGQTVAQLPQCCGSVLVSTQASPQRT
jgi:hypothetical protein